QPHFGGLWRPVRVLGLPAVHLDDLDVLAVGDPDAGTVEVEAPVVGPRDGCEVTFELVLPERIVRATLEEGRASLPVEGFERWDLDRPTRYDGTFTLRRDGDVLDRVPVKVAFRSIRAEGRRFLLNGRPLSVRGLLDWGYRPPFLAPDPSDELVQREIAEARARGFDLVKFCLWVPPRHVLEQFDAAGMLAW